MASPSTVVTLGFGSFGSVNLIPTLGFGTGIVVTTVGQRFCLTAMTAKRFDRSAVNTIPATLNAITAERYERTAANGLRANLTALTAERYELSAANSNCGDTCG